MPAVSIRVDEPGVDVQLVLVEGRHGVPIGYVGEVRDDGCLARFAERESFGFALAAGWRDGEPLRARLNVETAMRMCRAEDEALVAAAARVSRDEMLAAGFSRSFVDLLDAMSGWTPLTRLNTRTFGRFCGDGPAARSLRAFAIRAPLLAQLHARGAAEGHGSLGTPEACCALSPARMRAFSGIAWSPRAATAGDRLRDDEIDEHTYRTMRRMVAEVPLDWVPADPAGIRAFWVAATMLSVHEDLEVGPMDLAASCGGDWAGFVSRCEAAAPFGLWMPDYYGTSSYLADPADDLAEKVLMPLLAQEGHCYDADGEGEAERIARGTAIRLLYRDMALPGVVRTAAEWHARVASVHRAMPSDADVLGYEWPALLQPATVGGIAMRCLLTGADLRAEGAAGPDGEGHAGLDHCVGSYRARAHSGLCHVIGLRDARTGERLATAELVQARDGAVEVRQLRGHRNGPAPDGCAEALAGYVAGPVPYLPPRGFPGDEVRAFCGYDWTDASLVGQAVGAYAPFLPRGLRDDPAAILREMEGRMDRAAEGPRP